jgi:glutamine amidotransferase PdxT
VRHATDLAAVQALVLVGGWSNVQSQLLQSTRLDEAIRVFHRSGGYVLGLCAGMILSRTRDGTCCENRVKLGLLDVTTTS